MNRPKARNPSPRPSAVTWECGSSLSFRRELSFRKRADRPVAPKWHRASASPKEPRNPAPPTPSGKNLVLWFRSSTTVSTDSWALPGHFTRARAAAAPPSSSPPYRPCRYGVAPTDTHAQKGRGVLAVPSCGGRWFKPVTDRPARRGHAVGPRGLLPDLSNRCGSKSSANAWVPALVVARDPSTRPRAEAFMALAVRSGASRRRCQCPQGEPFRGRRGRRARQLSP